MYNINNNNNNIKSIPNTMKLKVDNSKEGRNKSKTRDKNDIHQLKTENNTEFKFININVLDDYELNNLNYEDALKLDKRSFIQIYCDMVHKNHLIMFTFCNPNDFNLIFLKISKLMFLLATNFATNVIFFFDESIHKIYINFIGFNLLQQIPQMIYSSLVSGVIEYAISFLILSEKDIHKIKNYKKTKKEGYLYYVYLILKCIRIKFILYFIFSFLFLIFYWYFVSSFCACV